MFLTEPSGEIVVGPVSDQPDFDMTRRVVAATVDIRMSHATVHGTGCVIANFAWQHLKAATIFRCRFCIDEVHERWLCKVGCRIYPVFDARI